MNSFEVRDKAFRHEPSAQVRCGGRRLIVCFWVSRPRGRLTIPTGAPTTRPAEGSQPAVRQRKLSPQCSATQLELLWQMDDVLWSGSNTGDACALFDTDGDGFANQPWWNVFNASQMAEVLNDTTWAALRKGLRQRRHLPLSTNNSGPPVLYLLGRRAGPFTGAVAVACTRHATSRWQTTAIRSRRTRIHGQQVPERAAG
jgi:hypothetical protein